MDVGAQHSTWSMSRNAQFVVMARASGEVGGAGRGVAADKAGATEGRGEAPPDPPFLACKGLRGEGTLMNPKILTG